MVFSSAIFLYWFLPITFLLYHIVPGKKSKNILLVIASLVFYAFVQLQYLPLLLFSVLCNYVFGRLLKNAKKRKIILTFALLINIGILCLFKYTDFLITSLNQICSVAIPTTGIVLPIGISFFTFQGISYVMDVYRNPEEGSTDFFKVLLYISFFPQLIVGPIIKYHDISEEIDNRVCTLQQTAEGFRRFIIGLSKKLLLSNTAGFVVDSVFALQEAQIDIRLAWLGAICYVFQIYFDFSGYSDMAIGLGKVFGFHFKENFNYPYTADSIKEFWRRWHISLSTWFRDYIYIPLGGNRAGVWKHLRNIAVVWFLTGLWHGAAWNFVFWGLLIFVLLVIEKTITLRFLNGKNIFAWLLSHLYVMLYIPVSWIIFAITDFSELRVYLLKMFPFFSGAPTASLNDFWRLLNLYAPLLIASVIFSVSYPQKLFEKIRDKALGILILLVVFWYSVYLLAIGINNPFLYFRF